MLMNSTILFNKLNIILHNSLSFLSNLMTSNKKQKMFTTFPTPHIQLDHTFIWQIWLLKTSTKGKSTVKLFYSWIVPTSNTHKGWQSAVDETSLSINDNHKKM